VVSGKERTFLAEDCEWVILKFWYQGGTWYISANIKDFDNQDGNQELRHVLARADKCPLVPLSIDIVHIPHTVYINKGSFFSACPCTSPAVEWCMKSNCGE
jgi:hypothetical protein